MKKILSLLISMCMTAGLLAGCGAGDGAAETVAAAAEPITETEAAERSYMEDLISAAQAEGNLTIYNSCEDKYLEVAAEKFEQLYGIDVQVQDIPADIAFSKIKEEDCAPSADIWFGGETDPYRYCAAAGLLEAYEAENSIHLMEESYRDVDGYWYGIYKSILVFMINREELTRLNLDVPADWEDLIDERYKNRIWLPNYNIAASGELIVNTLIQKDGNDEGIRYLTKLDKNVQLYPATNADIARGVAAGECAIGVCLLDDGAAEVLANESGAVELIVPASGMTFELHAVAILKGCTNLNAAKLWIEYILTSECTDLAVSNGIYRYMLLDNANQHELFQELEMGKMLNFDFRDAWKNGETYTYDLIKMLQYRSSERFLTQ